MSIATTIAALQTIHAAISGVTRAPTERPEDVKPAMLPCVIVRPGPLSLSQDGRALAGATRRYLGVCLVATPNSGRGISEGLAKSQTLMEAFAAAYAAQIEGGTLSTGGVITAYRDDGEPSALIGYGASDFEGFTFTVDVWEG